MVEQEADLSIRITEFHEAANWLCEKLSHPDLLDEETGDGGKEILNKINALLPIADRCDRSFRSATSFINSEISRSLEAAASDLWNCTAIAARAQKDDGKGRILSYCQLYASILLSISELLSPSKERKLALFKCHLTLFKLVIDHSWSELIKMVQELLVRSLGALEILVNELEEFEVETFQSLRLEYLLLSFQFSVKEGDLETARIYNSKANIAANFKSLDATAMLELCRIIYNAALELNDSQDAASVQNAISLLRDVQTYMELPIVGMKSHAEFNNLKFTSLLLLTNCLIESCTATWDTSECQGFITSLQSAYPKKAEPFILNIKLVNRKEESDNEEAVGEIIMSMIMSVDIVNTFDAVVSTINQFATRNAIKAVKHLDYVFMNKLSPENHRKWLDKAIVARFFTTTQAKTMTDSEKVDSLNDFCGLIDKRLTHAPSRHVLSSVITLLWNSGKKLEKSGKLRQSIGYYELALHKVLIQSYEDKAKIQRALQTAHINLNEFYEAEKVHEMMNARDRKTPLSQLLMLRIHLNAQDEGKAYKCLEKIKDSEQDKAVDIFILATAECKRCSNLAVKAMLMLFEMLEGMVAMEKKCSNFSFTTACLLRYTVQMIIKMAEDNVQDVFKQHLDTLSVLLKKGICFFERLNLVRTFEKKTKKESSRFEVISVDEIEWFASTSYNIALQCRKGFNEHHPEFATYSLHYIQMIPTEEFTCSKLVYYLYWKYRASLLCFDSRRRLVSPQDTAALRQLHIDCTKLLDDITERLNDDRLLRECVPEQMAQINECLVDTLILSFEIALDAKDLTKVRDILKRTLPPSSVQIDELLIQSATSIANLPSGVLIDVLSTVIERNIANTTTGDHLICSWLRCLLETGSDTRADFEVSLTDRILARLKTTFELTDPNLPVLKQEIDALATLTWNQGVRCIIKGDKRAGAKWCSNSISFAGFTNEALHKNLESLWVSLASSANIPDQELAASNTQRRTALE